MHKNAIVNGCEKMPIPEWGLLTNLSGISAMLLLISENHDLGLDNLPPDCPVSPDLAIMFRKGHSRLASC